MHLVRIAKAIEEFLTHPPVVLATAAGLSLIADRILSLPDAIQTPWKYTAFVFIASALYLWAGAFRQLKVSNTTVMPRGMPTALATAGPYRVSRNPIYLGYLLTLIGLGVYLGSPQSLVGALYFFCMMNWVIIPMEERNLHEALGAAYDNYRLRTRRWL